MPIGTIPKTTKLSQNKTFAVPSSVWTAAAKTCQNRRPSRAATVTSSTPMMNASPCASTHPMVYGRILEYVPVRPGTRVVGEQLEDDLNTADHDEEDTVGQEEPPSCRGHRLTIGT